MNKEFLKMQKLAGLINEGQFKQLTEDQVLFEELSDNMKLLLSLSDKEDEINDVLEGEEIINDDDEFIVEFDLISFNDKEIEVVVTVLDEYDEYESFTKSILFNELETIFNKKFLPNLIKKLKQVKIIKSNE
jgi:hypothetical protein